MTRNGVLWGFAVVAAMSVGAAGAQQGAPVGAMGGMQVQSGERVELPTVDLLSDTQGVDFAPYIHGVVQQVYGEWVKMRAQDAAVSRGATDIRFTIAPDGTIAAMHLETSTKSEGVNRAAWGAITGVGKFAALPAGFHGPNLELRIHFTANEGAAGSGM
jgi:TonB family protein